jgi:hypothetical protein
MEVIPKTIIYLLTIKDNKEDIIETFINNVENFVELPKNNYELIGTTSTLTDEQVEPFLELYPKDSDFSRKFGKLYIDYQNNNYKYRIATLAFNSLLQANNIDTTKNYCVLKLLNNE